MFSHSNRVTKCFSVKTRTENRSGISTVQHRFVYINYHPQQNQVSCKIRKITRKKYKLLSPTISPNWNQVVKTEIKQSCWGTHTTEKPKGEAGPELFPSYLPPSAAPVPGSVSPAMESPSHSTRVCDCLGWHSPAWRSQGKVVLHCRENKTCWKSQRWTKRKM